MDAPAPTDSGIRFTLYLPYGGSLSPSDVFWYSRGGRE